MIGVIGGSGVYSLDGMRVDASEQCATPYGPSSGPLLRGGLNGAPLLFLARHGPQHHLPPHKVNYRANLWALRECGATALVTVAAVGGIRGDCRPSALVLPDQILDYTWGREHTFFAGGDQAVVHVDFTEPYDAEMRETLARAAADNSITVVIGGAYAAMQGPRFESAAEIARLERDGAAVVGMTGMPEASLARELGLRLAAVNIVVNPAAGKGDGGVSMEEIHRRLADGAARVNRLLACALPALWTLARSREPLPAPVPQNG